MRHAKNRIEAAHIRAFQRLANMVFKRGLSIAKVCHKILSQPLPLRHRPKCNHSLYEYGGASCAIAPHTLGDEHQMDTSGIRTFMDVARHCRAFATH